MTLFCPKCGKGYEEGEKNCPKDGSDLRSVEGGEDRLQGRLLQGRFRLVDVLGRGGAGVVYRAVQLPIGREVAVKVVADTIQQSKQAHDRFIREAELASTLRHPNIVSPVDFGEDSELGVVYFAMEYVDGVDLRDILDGHRLTPALALEILYQTCGALTDAHDKEIIHRDLKPQNLRLAGVSDGSIQVKVLDLGIARPMDSQESITQTGNITGTIAYLPPEYVVEGRLCAPSDLYALGVIFFEMLTGQKPFRGNHLQVMFHHIKTKAPSINEALPEGEKIPEALEEFYHRLMEKAPEDRYQSAREIREWIEAFRKAEGISPITIKSVTGEGLKVKSFEPWLREVVEVAECEVSLPPEVLSNLKGMASEIRAGKETRKTPRSDLKLPRPSGLKKKKEAGLAPKLKISPSLPRPGGAKSSLKVGGAPPLPEIARVPEIPLDAVSSVEEEEDEVLELEGLEELSEEEFEELLEEEELEEDLQALVDEGEEDADLEEDDFGEEREFEEFVFSALPEKKTRKGWKLYGWIAGSAAVLVILGLTAILGGAPGEEQSAQAMEVEGSDFEESSHLAEEEGADVEEVEEFSFQELEKEEIEDALEAVMGEAANEEAEEFEEEATEAEPPVVRERVVPVRRAAPRRPTPTPAAPEEDSDSLEDLLRQAGSL